MGRLRRGQGGFTLLEVTLASAIATGMGLTCAWLLQLEARGWQASESFTTNSFELRRSVDAMARELMQSNVSQLQVWSGGAWTPMLPGMSGPGIRFNIPEDSADANTSVLDALGNVEWSALITYDNFTVLPGGSVALQRTQAGAAVTPLTLAYGVTALTFERLATIDDDSVVEINLTVQRARGAAKGSHPVLLSTRVRLRN